MSGEDALDELVGIQLLNYNELFLDEYQDNFDAIYNDLKRLKSVELEKEKLKKAFKLVCENPSILTDLQYYELDNESGFYIYNVTDYDEDEDDIHTEHSILSKEEYELLREMLRERI